MKNSKQILKENPITIQDLLSEGADEKIIYYGWLCMAEVINTLAINDEQKLDFFRKIKNEKVQPVEIPLWDK